MGIDAIAAKAGGRAVTVLVVALLLAVPCGYSFRMLWGFGGYVQASRYPVSWTEADRIMGDGPERILALPWHQYLPLDWTQRRVVYNPMASAFARETIVGDDAELARVESQARTARSRYLEFLLDAGPQTSRFGNLVSVLDVRYVLVSKTLDWRRYDWLRRQTDLRLVREWSDLILFENRRPTARVYAPTRAIDLADWGEVVGVAARARLADYAITVRRPGPGRVRAPSGRLPTGSSRLLPPRAASPVRYVVDPPRAGAGIVLSEPFDAHWASSQGRSVANLGVTNLFGPGHGELRYGRWATVRTGYVISGAGALVLLAVALILERRRRPAARRPAPTSAPEEEPAWARQPASPTSP